ncbi:ATP-binding cassette subfamily B protein [Actinokineospora baliensis]|uniref:ABC transporter ATP-binding protein n=1 Tax=Actinokineospora baliensis TaxID=547056 RepID=UPI00195B7CB7|nr:ABC transporter ATP-binding protein [Actinokineospora baliensis]MBM7776545.1 ATP-binding cassette subfamily B protein [Actinokineospora baliensis]
MIVQGRFIATVAQRLAYRLREQANTKLSRLPLRYFDSRPRGELLSRATNDIDNVGQTVQQISFRVLASFINFVGALTMMLVISSPLTAVLLVTMPAAVLLTRAIGKRAQPGFDREWTATGRLNGHVEEVYSGHEVVTAFGRHAEAERVFAEHNADVRASGVKAEFTSGLIAPAMTFLGNVTYLLVAVLGAVLVTTGALSIGGIQAYLQYAVQVNQPITTLGFLAGRIQSAVASAERVFALLDAEEQAPEVARGRREPGPGAVEFRDVSFGYARDQPLIEHLSLSVRPGQTVAIVGPTGAGKSTLVNLLPRFYDLDGGTITLDGVDIATMTRDDLRAEIALVPQDTWLFHGTIAENIGYGRPGATTGEILAAARAVHLDPLIRALPQGYQTRLDEDGGGLSAGERQLITLARAFLARATVLVLDEATSSVDTRTEVLVQRAMATLRHGRTSIIIAHRLTTIRDADVIVVLANGRIVEQGDHQHLLAARGTYARLHAAQFTAA